MNPKDFQSESAHLEPEFEDFLEAVAELVDTSGDGINSVIDTAQETSCKYNEFIEKYELSENVVACLRTLMGRKRVDWLKSEVGVSFDGKGEYRKIRVASNTLNNYRNRDAADGANSGAPAKRGGSRPKTKGEYNPRYAKQLFNNNNVSALLGQIEEEFSSNVTDGVWTEVARAAYLKEFLERVDAMRPSGKSDESTDRQIVQNLRLFLKEMGADKQGTRPHKEQTAINTVVAAAVWNGDISARALSATLGVYRKSPGITQLKKFRGGSQGVEDDDDEECSDSSGSETEGEGDDSDASDASDDSDDGDASDASDEEEQLAPPVKKQRTFSPVRAPRKDKRDLTSARVFWHEASQYNTDSLKEYQVKTGVPGQREVHRQRIQVDRTSDIHQQFLQSSLYAEHLRANPDHTIEERLFAGARCRCIKRNIWRKCADTCKVQFRMHFRALQTLLRRDRNIAVSALIIPPIDDTRQPNQFLKFEKRSVLETQLGTIELENFIVDRDSHEDILSFVDL